MSENGETASHVVVDIADEVVSDQDVVTTGHVDAGRAIGAGVDLLDVPDRVLLDRAAVNDERGLNTSHLGRAEVAVDWNSADGIASDEEARAIADEHTAEDVLIGRNVEPKVLPVTIQPDPSRRSSRAGSRSSARGICCYS